MQAIVQSARRRLNDDDELTMRAVASDVGLTGPGLYRYVNSMTELRLLMVHDIIGQARDYLDRAGERHDNSLAKIIAGAVAFRSWALQYPAEFRLAFASPGLLNSYSSQEFADLAERTAAERLNSPGLIGEYFNPLLNDRQAASSVRWQFDPAVVGAFEAQAASYSTQLPHYAYLRQADSPAQVWAYLYLWARLYGVVAFEVFNYAEPETITTGLLFRNMMLEMVAMAGAQLDLKRINALIDTEIALSGSN